MRQPVHQRRVHRVARADRVHHSTRSPGTSSSPPPRVKTVSPSPPRVTTTAPGPRGEPLLRRAAQPTRVVLRQLEQAAEGSQLLNRARYASASGIRPARMFGSSAVNTPRADSRPHQLLVRARARLEDERARAERHRAVPAGSRSGAVKSRSAVPST